MTKRLIAVGMRPRNGLSTSQNRMSRVTSVFIRMFAGVYQIRLLGRRIQKWNRRVYYVGKYVLAAGITAGC